MFLLFLLALSVLLDVILLVQETWCRLVASPENIGFILYGVQRSCFLLANTN